MLRSPHRLPQALVLTASLSSLACGALIGLDEMERVECVAPCAGAGGLSQSTTAGRSSDTGGVASGGTVVSVDGSGNGSGGFAGAGDACGGLGGSSTGGVSVGTTPLGGGGATGATGSAGGGAQPTSSAACPGGPEPPATWQEHWLDHTELLTRVHYDDCIAVYFDADVSPAVQDWLVPFVRRGWSYSLDTYGNMGSERLHVVVHQGRHSGGHVAAFVETSHDARATIDMGAPAWLADDFDLPARLLGLLVDIQGAHTKFGAPKAFHYGLGFALIYQYDLYLALGLDAEAAAARLTFDEFSNSEPSPDVHWFRDWFQPLWSAHGGAQLFVNYLSLLEAHYPAGANDWMPPMSYGQYLHFMSGAAGLDLTPLAQEAGIWRDGFDAQIAAAKTRFPEIQY